MKSFRFCGCCGKEAAGVQENEVESAWMRPPKGGLVDAVDDQVPEIGGAGASSGKAFCRKCMCKAVSAEGQFEFAGYVGSLA